jgi:hypothetical protein
MERRSSVEAPLLEHPAVDATIEIPRSDHPEGTDEKLFIHPLKAGGVELGFGSLAGDETQTTKQ